MMLESYVPIYLGKIFILPFYWNDCMILFRSGFFTQLLERILCANLVDKEHCQHPELAYRVNTYTFLLHDDTNIIYPKNCLAGNV